MFLDGVIPIVHFHYQQLVAYPKDQVIAQRAGTVIISVSLSSYVFRRRPTARGITFAVVGRVSLYGILVTVEGVYLKYADSLAQTSILHTAYLRHDR